MITQKGAQSHQADPLEMTTTTKCWHNHPGIGLAVSRAKKKYSSVFTQMKTCIYTKTCTQTDVQRSFDQN